MISNEIRKICKDFKKIENYSKAIKDKKTIWHCHHRLEIHSDYTNSAKDLKLMGIYYNRPPEELIFLTPKEHMQLHNNNQKKIDKIKDAHFKRFYGDDYTLEDVKDHRRAKNTERLGRWRNKHRKNYSDYQREYQRQYREQNKYYYGWKHAVEKNPDLTLDEYIKYRENKLKKKMAKSIKSDK